MLEFEEMQTPTSGKHAVGRTLESLLLPIVRGTTVMLDGNELQGLSVIAARVMAEEPALATRDAFGAHTRPRVSRHLWLDIGDTREIALVQVGHESTYECRLISSGPAG